MVGVYDNIQSFYASDDPYRFEYEGFYSSPTQDSTSYNDILPESSFQDFTYYNDIPTESSFYNFDPQGGGAVTGYRGGDPRAFAEEGEVLSRDEFFRARGAPDDRSYFKMMKEFFGLDDLLDEEDENFLKVLGRAAGLLDKQNKPTGKDGFGGTKYQAKSKTPPMREGARMSAAKQSVNRMAAKSRTAPGGDAYLRGQNISEIPNQLAALSGEGTSAGPRGRNIRDPNLSDIRTRKYVMKPA